MATMTQTFYVVNTVFEMGCMVTNVTVHTWRQGKKRQKRIVVGKCERTLTVNASYFSPPIVHWCDLRLSSFSDYQKFKNNSWKWKGNNSKYRLILWWGKKLDKNPYFMSQRELLLLRKRSQKHWKLKNISSPETCSFTDLWFDYRTFYSCSNCMKRFICSLLHIAHMKYLPNVANTHLQFYFSQLWA